LLCLLCRWQICMGIQAPALLVTATECAHNMQSAAASLHCTTQDPVLARVADG